MTYSDLLKDIYLHFDPLHRAWRVERENTGSSGVLAFLPDGYASATKLAEVEYSYWTVVQLTERLAVDWKTDRDFRDLIEGTDAGKEFLVVILEEVEGASRRAAHLHRITRVGTN
jgi:hypothetical protein